MPRPSIRPFNEIMEEDETAQMVARMRGCRLFLEMLKAEDRKREGGPKGQY